MNRLSQRVSTAVSGVRCPGCGKFVVPTDVPVPEETGDTSQTGERWSFVWRPPSGRVCPECSFPLERYARRLKWIRMLGLGVILVTTSLLLFVLGLMGGIGGGVRLVQQVLGLVGIVVFLVGLAGIVVGGKSKATEGA